MKLNILHMTPDFNYVDGRSYYVYLLLKYTKLNGHNVFLCTNTGNSFDRLNELNIPVFSFSGLSRKTLFLKSLSQLRKVISENQINIIHSHHRYYELLSNSLKKNIEPHTVFTALSIVDKRYFVEYKSERIIAVSNSVKQMLTEVFKIDKNKISVIPNFVDSQEKVKIKHEAFNTKNLKKKDSGTIILSIGRFHKEKNYQTLLNSISLLPDFNIKLILIGSGSEIENYKKIVKEKSLNVEFVFPQRNLTQYFDLADMCVLSSLRDPLPGFMLQCGLHRKPFIGSSVDGIAEVITDKETGLLFEKGNEKELSQKIKLFIENKSLAQKCSDNLNKLVMEKFTEKAVIPQVETLYEGLFTGKN